MVDRFDCFEPLATGREKGDYVRYSDYAALKAEIERLTKERDAARAANERDRTEVIVAVNALTDAFARRDWLIRGGRGSYEWDDDRFRDEFRDAMAELEPHVDRLRKIGVDRANCPETQVDVLAARAAIAERAGGVKGEWHRADGDKSILLYTLRQDGWRKGEAVMVNDVTVRIEAANGSEAPIEPIASAILSALTTEPAALEGQQEAATDVLLDLLGRAQQIIPDHYENWHALARQAAPFIARARPAEQAVTEAMIETAADEIADTAEVDFNGTITNRMDVACAAIKAAMEAGR